MATKKIPTIRFKGFTEDWEERKLREIGKTFTGLSGKTKEDFGQGNGRFITYMNVFSNSISNINQIEKVKIDKSQNEVINGDVLFTTSSETPNEVGMSSVWLGNLKNIYLNSFCFGYRPEIDVDNYYLAYLLRSNSFRTKMIPLAQGISRYNISKLKVMDLLVPLPQKPEQTQIGNFFKDIDEQIRLQEQKHEKLIHLKKEMLNKMFPKEGKTVPEIRFKCFTDNWEEKELGEVITINSGKDYKHLLFGNIPVYGTGGLMLYVNEALSYKNDAIGIGRKGTINKPYILNAPFWTVDTLFYGLPIDKNCLSFLFALFQKINWKSMDESTGVPSLSKQVINNVNVYMTNDKEQQKIGSYFENLDQLISQSQAQIKKYKNIKQALLQKMFV